MSSSLITILLVGLLLFVLFSAHIAFYSWFRLHQLGLTLFMFSLCFIAISWLVIGTLVVAESIAGINYSALTSWFISLPLKTLTFFIYFINGCLFYLATRLHLKQVERLNLRAIKDSLDNLPSGLCFYAESGLIMLANRQMDQLAYQLTGLPLENGLNFYEQLLNGSLSPGVIRLSEINQLIFKLPNGNLWGFTQRLVKLKQSTVTEIVGTNLTLLANLHSHEEKQRHQLEAYQRRLQVYDQDLVELKRAEERLALKFDIHEQFGYLLLLSRHFWQKRIAGLASEPDAHAIIKLWQDQLKALVKRNLVTDDYDWASFLTLARELELDLRLIGKLPTDLTSLTIFKLALQESITNAVRHAKASELIVKSRLKDNTYHFNFINNGNLPTEPIIEGGGLSSIRQQVLNNHGMMNVITQPTFNLEIKLPLFERGQDD